MCYYLRCIRLLKYSFFHLVPYTYAKVEIENSVSNEFDFQ